MNNLGKEKGFDDQFFCKEFSIPGHFDYIEEFFYLPIFLFKQTLLIMPSMKGCCNLMGSTGCT